MALLAGMLAAATSPLHAEPEEAANPLLDPAAPGRRVWFEAAEPTESRWRGSAELGYLGTRGNSNTVAAHSLLRIQNVRPSWIHTLRFGAVFASEADTRTNEQYRASQKSAYRITPDDYVFELVRYERDLNQGFRYRWSEVLGYGRRVFASDDAALFLEVGPGARQTRLQDNDWQREGLVYIGGEFDWNLSQTANFNQSLIVESGESNRVTQSVSALVAVLRQSLSLKLSHSITHNTVVPEDVQRTDTITAAGVVYSF